MVWDCRRAREKETWSWFLQKSFVVARLKAVPMVFVSLSADNFSVWVCKKVWTCCKRLDTAERYSSLFVNAVPTVRLA